MKTTGAPPIAIVDEVLKRSPVDQIEAVVIARRTGLTRFASSIIHQNVYDEDTAVQLRVAVDRRVGGVRTNRLTDDGLQRAVEDAVAIAKMTPPDDAFPGFPAPQPITLRATYHETTADATPEDRASRVREFVQECGSLGAAGALETATTEVAVGNSNGVRASAQVTMASFVSVVDGGDATAYVEAYDPDLTRITIEALARRAIQKVETGRAPRAWPAGQYTVILEPAAVGLMLSYLGFTVFNGKAVHEGRSFLSGRLGQRIVDERISIWDDPTDPRVAGLPFDFEGVPKRKLTLIDRGVASAATYDSRTAKLAGTRSTGHALPQPNPWGPGPTHMFLATGDAPVDRMIASTERGLLVTRFHYVRVVDPPRTTITGMTRDGTMLIEDGRIVGGVKNLRFNQSMVEALSSVDAIGEKAILAGESWFGKDCAPALKIRGFNFTGTTTF